MKCMICKKEVSVKHGYFSVYHVSSNIRFVYHKSCYEEKIIRDFLEKKQKELISFIGTDECNLSELIGELEEEDR